MVRGGFVDGVGVVGLVDFVLGVGSRPRGGASPRGDVGVVRGCAGFAPGVVGFVPGSVGFVPGSVGRPRGGVSPRGVVGVVRGCVGFVPGVGFAPGVVGFAPGFVGFVPGSVGFVPGSVGLPRGGVSPRGVVGVVRGCVGLAPGVVGRPRGGVSVRGGWPGRVVGFAGCPGFVLGWMGRDPGGRPGFIVGGRACGFVTVRFGGEPPSFCAVAGRDHWRAVWMFLAFVGVLATGTFGAIRFGAGPRICATRPRPPPTPWWNRREWRSIFRKRSPWTKWRCTWRSKMNALGTNANGTNGTKSNANVEPPYQPNVGGAGAQPT